MQWLEEGTVICDKVYYIFFRYHFSVDADTFSEVHQMTLIVPSVLTYVPPETGEVTEST